MFKSKAQVIHLFREHPDIAMEWADKTDSFKKLPERLHPQKPKQEKKNMQLDKLAFLKGYTEGLDKLAGGYYSSLPTPLKSSKDTPPAETKEVASTPAKSFRMGMSGDLYDTLINPGMVAPSTGVVTKDSPEFRDFVNKQKQSPAYIAAHPTFPVNNIADPLTSPKVDNMAGESWLKGNDMAGQPWPSNFTKTSAEEHSRGRRVLAGLTGAAAPLVATRGVNALTGGGIPATPLRASMQTAGGAGALYGILSSAIRKDDSNALRDAIIGSGIASAHPLAETIAAIKGPPDISDLDLKTRTYYLNSPESKLVNPATLGEGAMFSESPKLQKSIYMNELRKAYIKAGRSGALRNIPGALMMAGAPMATYGIKKAIGGYVPHEQVLKEAAKMNKVAYYAGYMAKVSAVKEKQDEEGWGRRHKILAAGTALAAPEVALRATLSPIYSRVLDPGERAIRNEKITRNIIEPYIKSQGSALLEEHPIATLFDQKPKLSQLVSAEQLEAMKNQPYPISYSTLTNTVHAPYETDPQILGHEIGHMLNAKSRIPKYLIGAGRILGTAGGAYGTVAAGVGKDQDVALTNAAIGSASMAPMIGEEMVASGRGAHVLGKLMPEMSRLSRLKTFVGVPSYMAAAGVPMATYGIKKAMGGYVPHDKVVKEKIKKLQGSIK